MLSGVAENFPAYTDSGSGCILVCMPVHCRMKGAALLSVGGHALHDVEWRCCGLPGVHRQ
jgi:hypothetical protein